MSKYSAVNFHDNGYYCQRIEDGKLLSENTLGHAAIQWVSDFIDATMYWTEDEAIQAGEKYGEMLCLPENEKSALDKRLAKLYNTWAFTNEELEDIRIEMVRYADEVYHNYSISVENRNLFDKEYKEQS